MKIWILKDGIKDGPFHDFEVRTKISDGLITPGMIAWHQGMDEWQKIEDIPLFKDAFILEKDLDTEQIITDELADFPPGINSEVTVTVEDSDVEGDQTSFKDEKFTPEGEYVPTLKDGSLGIYPFRRIAARLTDTILLSSSIYLFIILFYQQNPLIYMQSEETAIFVVTLFFLYEFGFTYTWGTTLGKCLMGLRVESVSSKRLQLLPSFIRTLIVLCVTMFSIGNVLLLIINFTLIFIYLKLKKTTPWDIITRSQIRGLPLTKYRVIGIISLLIGINVMTSFITPQEYHEQNKTFLESSLKEIHDESKSKSDKK